MPRADAPLPVVVWAHGGAVATNGEKAQKANPIKYVTKSAAPFLLVHGDNDPAVPFNQSELLAAALKKAGVGAELVPIKGGGHGGPEFFDKHLKAK